MECHTRDTELYYMRFVWPKKIMMKMPNRYFYSNWWRHKLGFSHDRQCNIYACFIMFLNFTLQPIHLKGSDSIRLYTICKSICQHVKYTSTGVDFCCHDKCKLFRCREALNSLSCFQSQSISHVYSITITLAITFHLDMLWLWTFTQIMLQRE